MAAETSNSALQNRSGALPLRVVYRLPGATLAEAVALMGGHWVDAALLPDRPTQHGQFAVCGFTGTPLKLVGATEVPLADLPANAWPAPPFLQNAKVLPTTECEYVQGVEAALQAFAQGVFRKVVLARAAPSALPQDFDWNAERFAAACERAPNAFVYFLASFPENTRQWAGASPELLLQVVPSNPAENTPAMAYTVALAGTRGTHDRSPFATKEYHEQGLVATYLHEALADLGTLTQEEPHPHAVGGGLVHLETRAQLALHHPDTPWQALAARLHPTPAVGGYPAGKAVTAWLAAHEPFDRELYAGYLGPLDEATSSAHLFVNIRCAAFAHGQAVAYAGAGLVAGSNAVAEWHETGAKLQAIATVLGLPLA